MRRLYFQLLIFNLVACATGTKPTTLSVSHGSEAIFSSSDVMQIQLSAPLSKLNAARKRKLLKSRNMKVAGTLYYLDSRTHWQTLTVDFGLLETPAQCTFPNLEIFFDPRSIMETPFAGFLSIGLNTHCTELPGTQAPEALQTSYHNHRQVLAIQMRQVLGLPAPRVRPVTVRYQDLSPGSTLRAPEYEAYFIDSPIKDLSNAESETDKAMTSRKALFQALLGYPLNRANYEASDARTRAKIKEQFEDQKHRLYQLVSEFKSDADGAQVMKRNLDLFFQALKGF